MDLFELDTIKGQASNQQLEYLRHKLKEEDLKGVDLLVQESRGVFRKYSHHLEAVFSVLMEAPNELHMKNIEESVVAYLKDQGVSASWITMIKGALRLRKMVENNSEWYNEQEVQILSGLETEKAYLTSRMTIEGQKKLCDIYKAKGSIPVREVREHQKQYQFDPSSIWKDTNSERRSKKSNSPCAVDLVAPKRAIPRDVLDLVGHLSLILDELADRIESWEKDPRVHAMVDRDLLISITKAFCVEWYEDSGADDFYFGQGRGFTHVSPLIRFIDDDDIPF